MAQLFSFLTYLLNYLLTYLQILEPLSTDLQLLVLRSAPSLRCLITRLPPRLHAHALRARFPSIDASASLALPPLQFTPLQFTKPPSSRSPPHYFSRPHPLQLWAAAAHACKQLPHLTRLRSEGPSMHSGDGGCGGDLLRGVGALGSLSFLLSLELPQLTLRTAGTKRLAEALACMPALTDLDLRETAADMHAFAPALACVPSLRRLNLSRVSLSHGQAVPLARHICALTALSCIDLSHASLHNGDWRALGERLQGMHTLRVLHLDHNHLAASDDDASSPDAANAWCALETLSLSCNWLLRDGAEGFLRGARSLAELNFTSTGLTAGTLAEIALPLCLLSQLRGLRLAGNGLGAAGVTQLGACFDSLTGLTALDLSSTEMDDAAALVLAMMIPALGGLQVWQHMAHLSSL